MLLETLQVDGGLLAQRTGWKIERRGACKGDVCVPLPRDAVANGAVDVRVLADRLGMPLVREPSRGLWALGPETLGGRALTTATAPELVLPDIDGNDVRLSSLRGRRVVLAAWASW